MLPQEELIERVRALCQSDQRLVAALMYGSFAQGEGDAFSDIEFALFFADEVLSGIDQRAGVGQIAPVALYFVNEFGNGTAIFAHPADLIRGEFHFDKASDIPHVETWRETDSFSSLEATLLLDRTGELSRHLQVLIGPPPERAAPVHIRFLCHSFVNWILSGANVLDRGECARALDILGHVHRYLLWLVRLTEGAIDHWPTPSRALERDLSAAAYTRFATCTANLDEEALRRALRSAWEWGCEVMALLADQFALDLPVSLLDQMNRRIATP